MKAVIKGSSVFNSTSSDGSGRNELPSDYGADDDVFYWANSPMKRSPNHLQIPSLKKRRNQSIKTASTWLTATTMENCNGVDMKRSISEMPSKKSSNLPVQEEVADNPFHELYRNFYLKDDVWQNKNAQLDYLMAFSGVKLSQGFHLCSPVDDEPFFGVLTFHASFLSCCPLTSFIQLSSDHPSYKTAFTPFGKRLLQICHIKGHDLRFDLSDELFSSWWRDSRNAAWGKVRDLKQFLRRAVDCYTDSDGVQWEFDECSVCMASCRFVRRPPCCRKAICQLCWQEYVRTSALNSSAFYTNGVYDLHCFACQKIVPYEEALVSLEPDDVALIRPPSCAGTGSRCPVCLEPPPPIVTGQNGKKMEAILAKIRKKKGGRPVQCGRCQNCFCSLCGSEVHPKTSCQKLIETEGFRQWMKQRNPDSPEFRNGRRCPKCSIVIAREGGCPTITCKCGTNFCFSCGRKKFDNFPMGHTSNRNVPLISCPKLWRSDTKRRLVHTLVGIGLVAGVCPLVVALSPIAIPIGLAAYFCMKVKTKKP